MKAMKRICFLILLVFCISSCNTDDIQNKGEEGGGIYIPKADMTSSEIIAVLNEVNSNMLKVKAMRIVDYEKNVWSFTEEINKNTKKYYRKYDGGFIYIEDYIRYYYWENRSGKFKRKIKLDKTETDKELDSYNYFGFFFDENDNDYINNFTWHVEGNSFVRVWSSKDYITLTSDKKIKSVVAEIGENNNFREINCEYDNINPTFPEGYNIEEFTWSTD